MSNKLEQFIEKITKETDFTETMVTLDYIKPPETIPFGILSIDKAVGIGDILRGMFSELYGNEAQQSQVCVWD